MTSRKPQILKNPINKSYGVRYGISWFVLPVSRCGASSFSHWLSTGLAFANKYTGKFTLYCRMIIATACSEHDEMDSARLSDQNFCNVHFSRGSFKSSITHEYKLKFFTKLIFKIIYNESGWVESHISRQRPVLSCDDINLVWYPNLSLRFLHFWATKSEHSPMRSAQRLPDSETHEQADAVAWRGEPWAAVARSFAPCRCSVIVDLTKRYSDATIAAKLSRCLCEHETRGASAEVQGGKFLHPLSVTHSHNNWQPFPDSSICNQSKVTQQLNALRYTNVKQQCIMLID